MGISVVSVGIRTGISVVSVVSISIGLSSGGSLSISRPLAVVVSMVGISESMGGKNVSISGIGKAISVDTIVSISISLSPRLGLSNGGSLGISGPLAIVGMVGIGIAVVSQAIAISMVGIAKVMAIAVVAIEGISVGLSLGLSLSSHGCEHAESGNGHGFHGDVIKLEELAGLPM